MIDQHIISDLLRNHEATNFGRIDNPETLYSRALNEINRLHKIAQMIQCPKCGYKPEENHE